MMIRSATHEVQQVAVIGTGTVGASWAAYFLAQGLHVAAVDPVITEADLCRTIAKMWPALESLGLSPAADPSRVRFATTINAELGNVQFVQENVPERLSLKRETLHALEKVIGPEVIISSSTSALLASDLQAQAQHPQRVLVGHPFNPPHLIPLVEVVAGAQTTPQAVSWAMDFYRTMGKVPVQVKKEAIGHIANRLTAALFREAVHLMAEGIATVEDIDTVVAQGPGLRWALQGPFTTYHLAGGSGGIAHYIRHLGPTQEARWQTLGSPQLTDEIAAQIIRDVQEMIGEQSLTQLVQKRDTGLVEWLRNQGR